MVHMNLMTLDQVRFQDIKKLRDKYMAMRKLCDKLCLKFGRCEDDARAEFKEKGIDEPYKSLTQKGHCQD